MEAREYVTLTNSASKRALFPSNRCTKLTKSDDEDSLGHMSPLRDSSPDRYSSPRCSPCWIAETPTKMLDSGSFKENLGSNLFQNVYESLETVSQSTPHKTMLDVVKDTPVKGSECDILTPFKCLTQKVNIFNQTPEKHGKALTPLKCFTQQINIVNGTPEKQGKNVTPLKCLTQQINVVNGTLEMYEKDSTPLKICMKRRNIEETPDSLASKTDAAQKLCWKRKLPTRSPEVKSDGKHFDLSSSIASLIRNSFYKPSESKAKASLFSDYLPTRRPVTDDASKSHKGRHLNATFPGGLPKKIHKRRIMFGEINAGVRHKVRKPKSKKKPSLDSGRRSTEVPLISPEQRVQQYVIGKNLLEKGDTPLKLKIDKKSPSACLNTDADNYEQSDKECPSVEVVPDPNKKFFKTNRTMAIDHRAVVTVINNVKIKVHKGKMKLDSPAKKMNLLKKKKLFMQEKPFEEEEVAPQLEMEEVKESVEEAIKKLELDIPEPEAFNESHHIQSITTSTSSLALHDDNTNNLTEERVEYDETQNGENKKEGELSNVDVSDSTKLFPVFYKRKGLYDTSETPQKKISPLAKKMRLLDENQYQIDAGQSRFRAVHCKECDTLYHLGDPEDEILHYNIHNNIPTYRFLGWKNERVIKMYPNGGRIIVIYPDDPKPWVNKIKTVLDAVDQEMGCVDGNLFGVNLNKVYLYVFKTRIVGVLAAQSVSEAFKMLDMGIDGPDCCSDETYPVKCGISRIWVAPDQRRKRVATSLLDCVRLTFMFDHILSKDEIAFTVPTENGKAFAVHYMKTQEFMVYYK